MASESLDLIGIEDELQDEERLVRDSVARFVDSEVLPIIGRHFADHTFPREVIASMARLGLLGSSIDGYGCAGLNAVCYGLICRELERGDSAMRSFVSVQSSLVMYPIHAYGSEEQRKRWLPALAKAEAIGCFGLTEAHGGSDPLNMNTTARRRGGDWVINGSKMWITNAPLSDVAVVWALTEEGVRGFLLEKGMPGFSVQEIERKFSLRASATGALFFDDVVVPEASMLPGSTVGLKAPLSCLTQARFGISWGVLGAAQACLDEALRHTKERVLFGRPLAATQAVQIRLAEMARKIAVGESLAMHLARRKDKGILTPVQVSLAKWNNCRSAIEVAREARDLLGGAGILAEYAPIRHALNLESVITYEGTETVHQLSLGRALTGLNAF
ncbi:MAG: acyl-CoA dehydrogenase [Gammaproteobacteria bacterium]|jgi:glutaryl-CoA dehydrogenase|nr:acyl-CoA dehydrogenase [Gammaproteobacteria bacterium]NBP07990.1 acyl-CoA dehydrogenase [Gammaproteobacteria bacterium]NBR17952.1 acyl-CoA dehydrogenase [Gammaproteobacteria bacterium]NCW21395.1 acyl-CoA dehydrogenase [Gammaproteobacteria bacterium]NCW57036.1 acyl-CoA dehydrogenase [Gammaproteobacteria bacterium]